MKNILLATLVLVVLGIAVLVPATTGKTLPEEYQRDKNGLGNGNWLWRWSIVDRVWRLVQRHYPKYPEQCPTLKKIKLNPPVKVRSHIISMPCQKLKIDWDQRYGRMDSSKAPTPTDPISFVGYKVMDFKETPKSWLPSNKWNPFLKPLFNDEKGYEDQNGILKLKVVTHVRAEISEVRNGKRIEFSSKLGKRFDMLGRRENDERGHIIANSLQGPSKWYNLAPQTKFLNHNVGATGYYGWYGHEQTLRTWLQNKCGPIIIDVFLDYNINNPARPQGFKVCVYVNDPPQIFQNLILDTYFDNEITRVHGDLL